ncbi:DUF397 domain-containing protein [Streptomyces sparsogenes]|uniref:DUF397 domain-containing protein n=1 Tax=Streptomyces sparsogenes TaxID=67365 RepID=UPI00384D1843
MMKMVVKRRCSGVVVADVRVGGGVAVDVGHQLGHEEFSRSDDAVEAGRFSSGDGPNCVELASGPTGTPHLRESDDPEVVIAMPAATLRAFLRAARAGEFDRMIRRC